MRTWKFYNQQQDNTIITTMNTNEDNNSIDFEQIVGKNFLRKGGGEGNNVYSTMF